MACLTDLFQPNFLLFLGIFVLAASLLIVYFESKMREQNHKLSSMFSLISALADEINTVKLSLTQNIMGGSLNNKHLDESIINDSNNFKNILINVSDDEEDDEDDEDEEDDDEDSDEDSDDEDIEEDINEDSVSIVDLSDDDSIKNLEINSSDLKVFKFEEKKIEENNSINFVNLEKNLLDILENSQHLENDINTIINDENKFYVSNDIKEMENNNNEHFSSEFKTIHINLEEQNETMDFKKLPVNKLRDIVTEKSLTNDATKLKKGELLKLLGCE
jgi:hypothetical protein